MSQVNRAHESKGRFGKDRGGCLLEGWAFVREGRLFGNALSLVGAWGA